MRKISKKRRFHEQVHITDLLFSLGLLCLFTISSLTVLLIGAHVYKQTALDMKTNYTTRTALTYVAEKVRQHDSIQASSVNISWAFCIACASDAVNVIYLSFPIFISP